MKKNALMFVANSFACLSWWLCAQSVAAQPVTDVPLPKVELLGTTLTMDDTVQRIVWSGGADAFVISGQVSRDLFEGYSFVFDDLYGELKKTGRRSFIVVWIPNEMKGLIAGINQYISLVFEPMENPQNRLTARVVFKTKLKNFVGDGAYLYPDVTPVIHAGRTVYRIRGVTEKQNYSVSARIGGVYIHNVYRVDDRQFFIDLTADQVVQYAASDAELSVETSLIDKIAFKTAHLGILLDGLDMINGDAYEVWPPTPACSNKVLRCLRNLSAQTLDLGSCGNVMEMRSCASQIGVYAREKEINEALVSAEPAMAELQVDAQSLVGRERADDFIAAVRAALRDQLYALYSSYHISTEAARKALAIQAAWAIDQAYAEPLKYAARLKPIPGDLQRERQMAADGLLDYLSSIDLPHTEFGRPLIQLVREFRRRHVEAIRYFREEAEPADWSPNPGWDNFVGEWLNLVEIRVDRRTGEVAQILFEID